jgi:Leucine-rich repeat (LRR) protein
LLFFTNLRFLNLEYNLLKAIPRTIFHSNVHGSLADVRLTGNRIESLERENFANLDMLQTVVLTMNRLNTIHTKAFYRLTNLVAISADKNKLTTIEKEAFWHLPALTKLDLQNNLLTDFSLASLTNVSLVTTLLSLNLSHNLLTTISSRSMEPLYTKTVDLSHNQLEELPLNILQTAGPYLRELHMQSNKLKSLGTSAFRYQENLQVLDVSNNVIKDLHPTSLQSLSSLQILDISNNEINSLPPALFNNMLKLRVLKASGNKISHLSSGLFRETLLERLDLSKNLLQTVPSQALEPINMTLRNVDLSRNAIQYFDHTTFESTRNILSLNIGGNQFRDLPYNLFEPMERLLTLDISNNDIYSSSISRALQPLRQLRVLNLVNCRLTEYLSMNLPSLTNLYLSRNELTGRSLRKEHLQRTTNLRVLDISYNKIEEIPAGAWLGVPHLASLNLSGNLMTALTKERFHGLHTLRQLSLVDLEHVLRFDSDSLSRLFRLEEVWLQTYPWIEKYRFRLGSILGYLTNLRSAHVQIRQTDLTDQLHGAALPKLKELEITGENLKRVDGSAFRVSNRLSKAKQNESKYLILTDESFMIDFRTSLAHRH